MGEELTPPETKGYTVSVLSAYLWAVGVARDKGVYSEEEYQTAIRETKELVDNFQTVIEESEAWYDRNRASIVNSDRLFVLGYGIDYGSMLEGMLKVGEMLRLPRESPSTPQYLKTMRKRTGPGFCEMIRSCSGVSASPAPQFPPAR